ncbi:rhomboid family intramembrane serine protease [Sorangium sp. So ce854]|uniref:rhomboid family intramembrane serine protease n=1 Tax=Sorangium sp. So ce854 TaxID=3133322 RepID=UPI003F6005E4
MIQKSDAPGGEGEEHRPGLTAIGPVMPERKIREWALVLQSSELWHVVQYTPAGWVLLVRDEDYDTAATSIDRYEAENRDWPPRRPRERPRHPPSIVAGVAFTALALFFFLVTGPASGGGRLFQRGTSVADLVIGPEPWRAITALTLHADSAHVIGNVISGTVFASAVQRRLGPGGTALAVVASGAIGNVANALWHQSLGQHHASIGASTAVFGAIGLLAATQLMLDRAHDRDSGEKRHLIQLVAPLVGGLALLGALGASPRADLGAHAFGLLSGAAIGLVAGLSLRKHPTRSRPLVQVAMGAVATGLVLGAWQLALHA